MLKTVKSKKVQTGGGKFAIVDSRYNSEYVDAMLHAARETLLAAGAHVRIVRVPGAFEIPAAAAKLAHKSCYAAIICLGVIFQGEPIQEKNVGLVVTNGLAQIQELQKVTVIQGVVEFEKVKHARVRCLGKKHNRGTEAAQTALEMARVMKGL